MDVVLHHFWRSGASYRVRIVLHLKNIPHRVVAHDLTNREHQALHYRTINPQGFVPAIVVGSQVLTQSAAIIEWAEEHVPLPPLLPAKPIDRGIVRSMASIVATDIHPLNNLRVAHRLRHALGASSADIEGWRAHWLREGLNALEGLVARHGGRYMFGDKMTLADCYILPQLYTAERFHIDTLEFTCLLRAAETALALPEGAAAHPDLYRPSAA